jgi:hypothetical protein
MNACLKIRYALTSEKFREPTEAAQIYYIHNQSIPPRCVALFICWLFVFSLYLKAKLLILQLSLLLLKSLGI